MKYVSNGDYNFFEGECTENDLFEIHLSYVDKNNYSYEEWKNACIKDQTIEIV